MVRVFGHYIRPAAIVNVALDFVLIVGIVMGVNLVNAEGVKAQMFPTVAHAFSLATCVLLVNTASGCYRPALDRSFTQSCTRVIIAAFIAVPVAFLIVEALSSGVPSPGVTAAALVGIAAVMAYRLYAAHVAHTKATTRVAILGTDELAHAVGDAIMAADPRAEVVGYIRSVNQPASEGRSTGPNELTGPLSATAQRLKVDEIVVALGERRGGGMPLRELLDCRTRGIRVSDLPTYFEKMLGQIRIDYVNASWLVFGDGFDQSTFRTATKRCFDVLSAVVLLVVTLPVMLLTCLAIVAESGRPVFYRQQRVGLNGRLFDVLKFRSMCQDAEKDDAPQWASVGDDRVTRVGRVIRFLRIDELPQLFNVLKGEMSMVGPRPERPYFVEQLTREIPYYAVRHSVKPGLTGWAQVRYHYGATVKDSQAKLQYDLYYVKNHTPFLDLVVLFETVGVVLTGKGAR